MTVFMTDLWWASLMTWGFECKSLALHRGSPWKYWNQGGLKVINICHTNLHFQLKTSGTTTRGSHFCTLTCIQPTLPRAILTNKLTPCASNSVANPPSKINGASSLMHCFRHAEEAMGTFQVRDGKWANAFLESHSRKQRCSGGIKRLRTFIENCPRGTKLQCCSCCSWKQGLATISSTCLLTWHPVCCCCSGVRQDPVYDDTAGGRTTQSYCVLEPLALTASSFFHSYVISIKRSNLFYRHTDPSCLSKRCLWIVSFILVKFIYLIGGCMRLVQWGHYGNEYFPVNY